MHCNAKTMIKVAAGLAAALGVAYLALPEFRVFLLASAPVLIALICPISMIGMMFMMKGSHSESKNETAAAPDERASADAPPAIAPGAAASKASP